jgi:hypothetical protein
VKSSGSIRPSWPEPAGRESVSPPRSISPAEQAGIQRGDLIVEFNGHKIDQVHKLPPLAEHIGDEKRGYYTGWLQTSPTLGIVVPLAMIIGTRTYLGNDAFTEATAGAAVWCQSSPPRPICP